MQAFEYHVLFAYLVVHHADCAWFILIGELHSVFGCKLVNWQLCLDFLRYGRLEILQVFVQVMKVVRSLCIVILLLFIILLLIRIFFFSILVLVCCSVEHSAHKKIYLWTSKTLFSDMQRYLTDILTSKEESGFMRSVTYLIDLRSCKLEIFLLTFRAAVDPRTLLWR